MVSTSKPAARLLLTRSLGSSAVKPPPTSDCAIGGCLGNAIGALRSPSTIYPRAAKFLCHSTSYRYCCPKTSSWTGCNHPLKPMKIGAKPNTRVVLSSAKLTLLTPLWSQAGTTRDSPALTTPTACSTVNVPITGCPSINMSAALNTPYCTYCMRAFITSSCATKA